MNDASKTAVAGVDPEPGPAGSLTVLGHAADWAARTMLTEVGDDDAAAFECVVVLDKALSRVAELLGQVPELLRIASPGAGVSNRLAAAEAELGRQQAALSIERGHLEAARCLERRAAEIEAERDGLRDRIARLERSRLIGEELPALRVRRAELEAAVPQATAEEGEEVVRGLETAARRLLELTEEQRSLIAVGNGQLVSEVAAAAAAAARELARRDELSAELAARELEAEQLLAEQQRILPGLAARQQADRDLAVGLDVGGLPEGDSAVGRVRAELAGIEQRIADIEAALKPLLRQHAQEYENARQVRGMPGGA